MPDNPTLAATFKFYLIPLILFAAVATGMYHFYQYRIISDDFSYLAIAQRYINGDYKTAVNGYWSPLNIWILALWVKCTGMSLLPASYLINCCSFAAFTAIAIHLSKSFITGTFGRLGFGICMALFCAFNIPVTHFADAMNCVLLFICFGILLKENFTQKPLLWILWGFVAAIAYFSKAYSFYILPLTLAVALYILLKKEGHFSLKKWIQILAVSVACMILFSFPWLYLLHQKYGIWTASTAGGINTNWAIQSTIYFSDQYKVLVPPSHPNSLSCWEDPWINHGKMLSAFGSASLFIKQVFRMCMNAINWFTVTATFSPFYFPIWIAGLILLFKTKIKDADNKWSLLMMSFLIFPAGYLMLSFGTRYLWFTVPLVMLLGLYLLKEYLSPKLKPIYYKVLLLAYFGSWLPGAAEELKTMFNEGKSEFEMAQQINKLPMHGSFLTNIYDNYQTSFRLSYFTGNQFYMHFGDNWSTQELIHEAEKQNVQYYYYFYQGTNDDYKLKDATGRPFPEVSDGKLEGLKVFKLF
jgi:hypothetical protein